MSLGLELQPERAFLRRRSCVAIRELSGFERGRHRLPGSSGRAADQFVHGLAEQALVDEVRTVYDGAKRLLGLRRRQLVRAVAAGGGNVDAPQFQFVIEVGVDPDDLARALWQRRVILLVGPRALPLDFDAVFPVACDELVVPFAGAEPGDGSSFDRMVDRLEDFAEQHGGEVEEDEDSGRARLCTRDGSQIAVDLAARELSLRFLGVDGCRDLMLEAQRRFAELAGPIVSALADP